MPEHNDYKPVDFSPAEHRGQETWKPPIAEAKELVERFTKLQWEEMENLTPDQLTEYRDAVVMVIEESQEAGAQPDLHLGKLLEQIDTEIERHEKTKAA